MNPKKVGNAPSWQRPLKQTSKKKKPQKCRVCLEERMERRLGSIEREEIGLQLITCKGCRNATHGYCYGIDEYKENLVEDSSLEERKEFLCDVCNEKEKENRIEPDKPIVRTTFGSSLNEGVEMLFLLQIKAFVKENPGYELGPCDLRTCLGKGCGYQLFYNDHRAPELKEICRAKFRGQRVQCKLQWERMQDQRNF